jgi:tetratricopeptide (TPR) repeat protein
MKITQMNSWCLVLISALAGCSGFGVASKTDPIDKLNQAESLYIHEDRPLMAEILIFDAMKIAKERQDLRALGSAHREYADLLRSPSITGKWAEHYRSKGFVDRSITFDTRLEKSNEYYRQAISYYDQGAQEFKRNNQYDLLTNVQFNTATSYSFLGEKLKACSYFDLTLAAHTEHVKRHPEAKEQAGSGKSVSELVAVQKKKNGCL